MRLRPLFVVLALAIGAACSDEKLSNPSGGSSGVPNNSSSSSSSSSGGSKRDGGGIDGGDDDDDDVVPPGTATVRIVAGNISSGPQPKYDEGSGTRIFKGLKADIALVQELNVGNNSETAVKGWVTSTFGADYTYFRETGFNIPNAVVSRYPILESGTWASEAPDRGFAYAKLDVPGDRDLWAVSVHFLTDNARRNDEAIALVAKLKTVVKAGEYVVVGGDLNTDATSETCLTTLDELIDAPGARPADKGGNQNTNLPRGKPYDYVLSSPNLSAQQVPTVIGANSFEKGLVFDSRVYTPLADVAPVQAGDSAAQNMQHMAVVKDFRL